MSPRLPALRPRDVLRALERAGFFVARTDLKPGTLRAIIKQAGFTVQEFLELL